MNYCHKNSIKVVDTVFIILIEILKKKLVFKLKKSKSCITYYFYLI